MKMSSFMSTDDNTKLTKKVIFFLNIGGKNFLGCYFYWTVTGDRNPVAQLTGKEQDRNRGWALALEGKSLH